MACPVRPFSNQCRISENNHCGALGERLKFLMELLQDSVSSSIERTREVVIRCLMEYLGEDGGDLIKEFNLQSLPSFFTGVEDVGTLD
ncbi:hypothetical protein SKAU_G00155530 [Synaphobranchus kaupii]|uniref:Uncharacterized protein n=1 Tax=Synaphobranchus kaupii TaxID=118154 RepID=A0A9Q1IYV5_SYNKA|nr:hypothetical protein SKAU_G00155530 [Synaphobranchus kaupii]